MLTLGLNVIVNQAVNETSGYAELISAGSNHTGDGIVNQGTINAQAVNGSFYIEPYNFTNQGTINVSNGDKLYIEPTTFTNNGAIAISEGTVDITTAVSGTGNFTINAGTLELAASSAETVTFESSGGTLKLDNATSFSGEIAGITGSGDILDFTGYDGSTTASTAGGYNAATNTTILTVTDPGHTTLELTLAGNLSGSSWTVTEDSSNTGVDIYDPPATAVMIATGGTLAVNAPFHEAVTFAGGTGTLALDQPNTFSGQISGFTGTTPDPAHSDTIDLVGINYNSPHFSEAYNASTGLLTVSDGTNAASLTFVNFDGTLNFASDGNGGTLITDPPKASSSYDSPSTADAAPTLVELALGRDQFNFGSGWTAGQSDGVSAAEGQRASSENQSASVSLGGPGNDNFIFHPSLGTDVRHFEPPAAATEFDQFSSAQDRHWSSLVKADAIEFTPHSDGIMPPDLDASHWHLALQHAFHLN